VRTHVLERQQWIDQPLGCVFEFFSRAENLARITPPWMHFELRARGPIEMRSGARIDYRIKLWGVPMSWRTRIEKWDNGSGFVDVQERGPYRQWEHHHSFSSMAGGTLMSDRVNYCLPMGLIGEAAHGLGIRRTLDAIFDYRFASVREIYP
jgi:ligand-binding SRPBCC domain-containing protein